MRKISIAKIICHPELDSGSMDSSFRWNDNFAVILNLIQDPFNYKVDSSFCWNDVGKNVGIIKEKNAGMAREKELLG